MGYCVSKGYGVQFCAQKFGAQAKLWVIRDSTVPFPFKRSLKCTDLCDHSGQELEKDTRG